MATNMLFYYFGDDEAYFRALQGEFQRHTRLSFQFKRIYESSESKIQTLFLNVYRDQPQAVFIDFSKHTQDYLHLARLIARIPLEHKMVTIGLVDYLSPPEILSESIATGVSLTHIKSPETYDVVFDVSKIIAPQEIGEHGFAMAQLKEEWEAAFIGKVGYIDGAGLHIETNFSTSKGDRLKIKHHWQTGKIVPSSEVFVKEVSNKNLFYHFKLSADVEFLFVDEFNPPEGMEPERIKEKQAEREDAIRFHKKQLSRWIEDNLSRSQEKKGKVLVVDRELHFYHNQMRSDKHPYIIRSIPYLQDISSEMDRLQPQVIAFSLEKKEVENPRNHQQVLVKLAEAIKVKYLELNPFIVVFNSPVSSQEMQEILGYTNVMAVAQDLSVELLVKMADLYDKKRNQGQGEVTKAEEKVFLRKTNNASICEFMTSIKVSKLSETDLFFQCDRELEVGTNLHLTHPVEMYVHVQPTKNAGVYHGLIHCLSEVQKKELRKFVNSVFFREHDAALMNESEEFKRLNESKLQEKLAEATKRMEEEVEKREQEEAQKKIPEPTPEET